MGPSGGQGGWLGQGPSYLSNHHRESEDTREIVQQLEDNFKERLGVWQPADGDEGLYSPVVTANVTGERGKWALVTTGPTLLYLGAGVRYL
jgi:hypothetical protein